METTQAATAHTGEIPAPLWQFQLLGGLRATCGEYVLEKFQTQKTAALLAYLVFHPNRRHAREELIDLLWPEAEPDAGRNRFSQALVWLRPRLEFIPEQRGTVLRADRQSVDLNPQAVTVDVFAFEAAIKAAGDETSAPIESQVKSLEEAASLYAGDLLPGHYEAWVLAERQHLLTLYLSVLLRLITYFEGREMWEEALGYARRALIADPLSEELHCTLIRLLAVSGQTDAALRQFRELERVLDKELEETPSPNALALIEQIRLSKNDLTARRLTVRPQSPAPIMRPLTRFFGRQTEMTSLRTLLTSEEVRLVTLTGTGGTGKTRLAIEAAALLAEDYRDRLWFVPLADTSDPAMLPVVLRNALQLPRSNALSPLKQVSEALLRQPSLLILDNLEHLVEGAAPLIRSLLEQTPSLKLLVTSRQRLALDGEHEISVLPLVAPVWEDAQGQRLSLERLMQVESVRLFVDRAQSIRPAFAVTPQNAEAIARLCQRLEGLPLAIELCASWAQTLTPAQMLAQLTRRFDLLISRRADIAPRHRSLRAALEYSYLLLPADLQQFFIQLSIFRGGWTLEAAEAVCLDHTPRSGTLRALTHLTELCERSLLIVEERSEAGQDSGMRYRMLEALREFAAEQLTLSREDSLRQRHSEFFLALAEEAQVHLTGLQQSVWLARLETEHDNLRGALDWAVETQAVETGLHLAIALSKFWEIRGYFREAQQWLGRLVPPALKTGPSQVALPLRALALNAYANALDGLTDFASAEAYATQALALWREIGEASGIASSLAMLGSIAMMREDYGPAVRMLQEARSLARSVGDEAMAAGAVHSLGRIALAQENWAEASLALSESLDAHRKLGDRNKAAAALNNLGLVARYQGDLTAAHGLLTQALSEHRALGDRPRMAISLLNIGTVERINQHFVEALVAVRQAATLALEVDNRRVQTWCIKEFGHLMCANGNWKVGVRLLSASENLRQTLGMSFSPADPGEISRDVSLAQSALGTSEFEAAWHTGSRWTIHEAFIQAWETSGWPTTNFPLERDLT